MKKKIVMLLLATCILSGSAVHPITTTEVHADVPIRYEQNGDFLYRVDTDDTIVIAGYTGAGGDVVIPEEIDGKKVTEVEGFASSNQDSIKSIMIPESVTHIVFSGAGENAFSDCSNLENIKVDERNLYLASVNGLLCSKDKTQLILCPPGRTGEVVVPEEITKIGKNAFRFCEKIESIVLPAGVTDIDTETAFRKCGSLKTIVVNENNPEYTSEEGILYNKTKERFLLCPEGKTGEVKVRDRVVEIGAYAFQNCSKVERVDLPGTVKEIGTAAFSGCSGLKKVDIPETVTAIADSTFYECTGLEEIVIPKEVESLGSQVFRGCSNLKSVTILGGIKNLGAYAFSYCSSLENIELPEGLMSIEENAFYNCSSLESIRIPAGVTAIGDSAFEYCSNLKSIIIPQTVTSIGNSAFEFCRNLSAVTLPESLTALGERVFMGCENIDNIVFPNGITTIKYGTFSGCKNLKSVVIPTSVTSVEGIAFEGCSSLESIELPETVQSIENRAFEGCSRLKSIVIPKAVTQIGYAAFRQCNNLESITVDPANANYVTENGILYNKTKTKLLCCSGKKQGEVVIPKEVTEIEDCAFDGCGGLESIVVDANNANYISENGILYRKDGAIIRCPEGKKGAIELPKGITGLPEGLTTIGRGAFENCSSLVKIVIPESVTSIDGIHWLIEDGMYTIEEVYCEEFVGCTSLESIEVAENNTEYTSENGILYDKKKTALLCCPKGKKGNVEINENTTKLAYGAFEKCGELESVTIPKGINYISSGTFKACIGLKNIKIPKEVTGIGENAFAGCSNLQSVAYMGTSKQWKAIDIRNGNENLTGAPIVCQVETSPDEKFYSYCELEDGTVQITGYTGDKSELIIPAVLAGKDVAGIGGGAFKKNTNLVRVVIPEGVTTIGDYAFYGCSNLRSIEIPKTVERMEYYPEDNSYPTDVKYVGIVVFGGCTSLENINVHKDNAVFSSEDGVLYDKEKETILYCGGGKKKVVIPQSVTGILSTAFRDCIHMESIEADKNNTRFESENGVLYSKGKKSIEHVPGGKTGEFIIPEGVWSIGDDAFYGCSGITSLTIPESIGSVGQDAFKGCNLQKVHYLGTKEQWEEINYGYWIYVWDLAEDLNADIYYEKLSHLEYADKTAELTGYHGSQENFVIPAGINGAKVTYITGYAFENCTTLKSITIPESVKEIGKGAFAGCVGLQNVYYAGDKAGWEKIAIDKENDNLTNATIHFAKATTDPGETRPDPYKPGESTDPVETRPDPYKPTESTNPVKPDTDPYKPTESSVPEKQEQTSNVPNESNTGYTGMPLPNISENQKSEKIHIALKGQELTGTVKVRVKKSYNLNAVVTPENTASENAVVTWKSSDESIATVSSEGVVSIRKKGTVTITATTADGKCETITLKAGKKTVKVNKMILKGRKTMKVRKSQKLKLSIMPVTADNQKVTWISSDKAIATVNSKGKVTAKKKGIVKITAVAKDGSKKKVAFTITVK